MRENPPTTKPADPPFSESSDRAVEWMTATFISLIALLGLAMLGTPKQLAVLSVGLLIQVLALLGTLRPVSSIVQLSAPFVVPLIVIHSVLNPQYQITSEYLNFIPFRSDGFRFGLAVSLRVISIFVLGIMWFKVDREKVVADLIRLGTPLPILLVAAQAIAVTGLIQRRAHTIYDAQQARGIRVGPGLFARIAALPKVMIPLFVTVISDADSRSTIMATRGFGCGPVSVWTPIIIDRTVWISVIITTTIVVTAAYMS